MIHGFYGSYPGLPPAPFWLPPAMFGGGFPGWGGSAAFPQATGPAAFPQAMPDGGMMAAAQVAAPQQAPQPAMPRQAPQQAPAPAPARTRSMGEHPRMAVDYARQDWQRMKPFTGWGG